MEKRQLNIRFHDPNTKEKTLDYIMEIFIKANRKKLDSILKEHARRKGA